MKFGLDESWSYGPAALTYVAEAKKAGSPKAKQLLFLGELVIP